MKTSTRSDILAHIRDKYPLSVKQLRDHFGLSNVIIHRHLNTLLDKDLVYKTGKPPKVYYFPKEQKTGSLVQFNDLQEAFLAENFFGFDSMGNQLEGSSGFVQRCEQRSLQAEKEVDHYIATLGRYHRHFDPYGLIDGTEKLATTFSDAVLDAVYYLDFYSIEKYGKTKLGALMYFGKQSGDLGIISLAASLIQQRVHALVQRENIDAIAYIPHSLDRPVQLMPELKKQLAIALPELTLLKIFRDKVVPQKSLKKTKDRLHNAASTIFIGDPDFVCDTILLLDDAVGSGATLHETAKKIIQRGVAKRVIGLAMVGSFKGFDVITEV